MQLSHLLAKVQRLRDRRTALHAVRVTRLALSIAEVLRLPEGDRYHLSVGAPLHDIGKVYICDGILRKAGRLTARERRTMRSHTVRGADLLSNFPELAPILPIIRSHHECWDGTGYPDGLAGVQIPYLARVVAVADSFDAMTSDRPYRPLLSRDEGITEIQARSGQQFDPDCVQAFLKLRR